MDVTDLKHGDPIPTASRSFLHFRQHNTNPKTTICSYFPITGTCPKSVTSTNIISLLCLHDAMFGLQHLGFYPREISSQLLRSGGVMTLHQSHFPNNIIKIIRRWCSDAILIYLQVQVATFTKGIATAMAETAWFHQQVAWPCTPAAS